MPSKSRKAPFHRDSLRFYSALFCKHLLNRLPRCSRKQNGQTLGFLENSCGLKRAGPFCRAQSFIKSARIMPSTKAKKMGDSAQNRESTHSTRHYSELGPISIMPSSALGLFFVALSNPEFNRAFLRKRKQTSFLMSTGRHYRKGLEEGQELVRGMIPPCGPRSRILAADFGAANENPVRTPIVIVSGTKVQRLHGQAKPVIVYCEELEGARTLAVDWMLNARLTVVFVPRERAHKEPCKVPTLRQKVQMIKSTQELSGVIAKRLYRPWANERFGSEPLFSNY